MLSNISRSDNVLCSCAWHPAIQDNSKSAPCPCLFSTNLACYWGYNLRIVAALFAVPTVCSRILCGEYVFLWRAKYFQPVTIFELLASCVLPVCYCILSHHDTLSSCVKFLFFIWGDTKSSTEHTKKYCKSCAGAYCCFRNQLCTSSYLENVFIFQHQFWQFHSWFEQWTFCC
jgi:hypothetical protein